MVSVTVKRSLRWNTLIAVTATATLEWNVGIAAQGEIALMAPDRWQIME